MYREYLRSKLHHARVTETDRNYEGSITVDRTLLDAGDIAVHQKVQVVNVENGNRFETYTIEGGAGEICLNGAAARLAEPGDRLIVMAYGYYVPDDQPAPTIVTLDGQNQVID